MAKTRDSWRKRAKVGVNERKRAKADENARKLTKTRECERKRAKAYENMRKQTNYRDLALHKLVLKRANAAVLKIREKDDGVSTPLDTCEKLMPNRGLAISQLEYSRVIGFLMYAMTCTRPDIAFAVGKLSRYTSNPGTQHWQAIQRVLNNIEDNSSTSDWVFQLGGGAISWASKKQTCIIGSTMKSEFVALAADGKEAEWLKNFLLEIPLWVKPIAPISIRYDSVATLAKAYSQMYNEKSRHLGVRHRMIHELITNGVVSIEFVRSQQNLVDHLTKGLARDLVIKSAEGIRLNQTKSINARTPSSLLRKLDI
nr:zinc finger, CCHC-type [Tanacetum cinerariifolium]